MFEISEETANVCKSAFNNFIGTGLYIGLFFMSIIFVVSYLKKEDNKDKKIKIVLGVYSIIVLVLNLNPLFAKFLTDLLNENSTYWRVYWLLPIGVSVAFMFTDLIFRKERKIDKIIICVLIFFTIILSGNYMYNSQDGERFEKVNNYYKVPNDVLSVIQKVSEDDEEYKKIAGPEAFLVYTRQIDGTIALSEYRHTEGVYNENSIVTITAERDANRAINHCLERKCNYLVVYKDTEFTNENLVNYNIKKMYENESYTLYKFKDVTLENN